MVLQDHAIAFARWQHHAIGCGVRYSLVSIVLTLYCSCLNEVHVKRSHDTRVQCLIADLNIRRMKQYIMYIYYWSVNT